jgi:hypothetical protein
VRGNISYVPNGWPSPVASWQLRNDFHAAIGDGFLAFGDEASRTDGVDDCSDTRVAGDNTIRCIVGSADAFTGKIDGIPVQKLANGDICCIESRGRYNMQSSI